ncbi:polysaccharide biosynthesis/export family protein [Thalassotalea agarivorans]|uniref:Protein involved in polysaccharide export, contains SLBB domain of the beta-grasp fold n=1 Tax=Thalassotalea agarivorans TaxID=349064 RepID=A0A1H9YIE0_THASX|nr:polysaccharide biosynthesis/export family protein [Thalassotalea agarivorans]SES68757.1 protein involved in polysaccharide export, contains SLBB domain of the beta-grasp fold [Thalassotalea agarivorans]
MTKQLFLFFITAVLSCSSFAIQSQEELLRQYQNQQSLQPSGLVNSIPSVASSKGQSTDDLLQLQSQLSSGPETKGQLQLENRNGLLLPGEANIRDLLPLPEDGLAPPFGANIFAGGYETERIDGLNDNYLVAAGDKLSIWMWGAVSFSDVATVDNQGNIFIPNIGPIKVADVPASNINNLVSQKIKAIYRNNVEVYVNLLTATPVSVYVTGYAVRPGQYAGMASDSLLYFLKRAGGIDSERGSYRNIEVLRNGEVIHAIDLYKFIQFGYLEPFSFKDKDVILVNSQSAVVNVTGGVKNPFRFEFLKEQVNGLELLSIVKPLSKTSHVAVAGSRKSGPFSVYLPIDEFANYTLENGDKLYFNDDLHAQIYDIEVLGAYLGPSYYAVKKQTKLYDLLDHIEVEPELADVSSIYILRQSVALKQKEMLDRSLDRLEQSVYAAPASSTGEASIRTQEATLISQYIERARNTMPQGKVIVADKGKVANIVLEQGDKIVIPSKTDLVQVGGEVLMPQAVVYSEGATIEDYIAWAGGYSVRANYEDIVVVHANGLSEFFDAGDSGKRIQKGDQIIVLPRVEAKTMQSVKDFTQILYQIAVAVNAVN